MNEKTKHVFILNPVAGKGAMQNGLSLQIARICEQRGVDYEIHQTESQGDANTYVRACCLAHPHTNLRFYACGGDGTLNETVNGAYGFANASVGVIPVGTGNDFVRNFEGKDAFLDIEAQLDGETVMTDLLRYNDCFCVNMVNIGFDCEVVKLTAKLKKSKLVPKGLTYIIGLVITLIRKPGVEAVVTLDDGEPQKRRMLLTSAANGAWCGGGFHSTPLALLQDGVLDALLIKNVGRIHFLSLVKAYKQGTILENNRARKVIDYVKCHTIRYEFDGVQSICVDGEVTEAQDLCIDVVPAALGLIVPRGATYAPLVQERQVGVC